MKKLVLLFIIFLLIGLIRSCEDFINEYHFFDGRDYDEEATIFLNESDPICDTIKKNNNLDEYDDYLDIGYLDKKKENIQISWFWFLFFENAGNRFENYFEWIFWRKTKITTRRKLKHH